MVSVPCPHCGRPLEIPDRRQAGQRLECPHCRQAFVIKTSSEEQPQPARPSLDASAFESGGAFDALAGRVSRAKKRRSSPFPGRIVIPAGVAAGIALVAVLFVWNHFANRRGMPPGQQESNRQGPVGRSSGPIEPATAIEPASVATISPTRIAANRTAVDAVASGPRPIRLLLAPAGVRMLVHLRPAELWRGAATASPGRPDASIRSAAARAPDGPRAASASAPPTVRAEEIRRCLAPVVTWTERQIADFCLFPPEQIEEVVFSFVLRAAGDPPDVAATVWLVKPANVAEIAGRFDGRPPEKDVKVPKLPTFIRDDRALVIRDAKTFASGPRSAVQEMAEAVETPNPTDASIEELLKHTDRNREITFVFRPDDLDRLSEVFGSPSLANAARHVAEWLDPDATEGAIVSFRLTDPFRLFLTLRNRTTKSVSRLEEEVRTNVDGLPARVLAYVERLKPQTSGRRKLLGRYPAMWKAVALGTMATTGPRVVKFESVLPERAAANLSLATYLALMETPEPNRTTGAAPAAGSRGRGKQPGSPGDRPQSVAERLETKIDVDLRRAPLSDAFNSIGDDIGVAFELDGAAFKNAGYTKNMAQTLRLSGVPAIHALRAILKPYPKMALVVSPDQDRIIVTTQEAAQAKGQRPLELGK